MVVAIFATLKAGFDYLPMDPSYPDERIQYMQNDSQASIILTHDSLESRLSHSSSIDIVCLDSQQALLSTYSQDNIPFQQLISHNPNFSSGSLAYMIYTSGSTGQPKGVLCHHKGLVNLLNDYQHKQQIKSGDHCSAWSTFSFDASVYELFTALTAGGVLHIIDEAIRSDGQQVIDYFNEYQINHCFFPAVYLQQFSQWLVEHPNQSSLKRMMTGVEAIDEGLLMKIQGAVEGLQIINSYGPTEATIICLAYLIDANKASKSYEGGAPIGTPIENVQIYILDEYRNPVPIGVQGEIYVGGVGVTQGYWNNEALNAEKFVTNVFAPNKSKNYIVQEILLDF
jgi:amino acid adenylation domain-containing protein